MRKFFTLSLSLLCAAQMFAMKVAGVVTDTENNPLAGATIAVAGMPSKGTMTDFDGKFEISLPDGKEYILTVTYTGFHKAEKSVDSNDANLVFVLEEDAILLDQVVVTGTRTPKLLKDVPVVTRVIPESDIKRIDVTNVGDLLQSELPGIEFSYSMNQQKSLNMSGFGGNAVLFLVDGERIAGETLNNIDYDRLNMDNVERIEIVKGAASSLYGSNAVGGVVNLISKQSLKPWYANAYAKYGAHNSLRYGGTIGFNAGIVNSTTNVQATSVDQINMDNDGDYTSVFGHKTLNVKERLIFTFSDKFKLTARAGFFFRQREASETSKDRYYSYNAGLKANYIINERNDIEASYSFDQYDKSDYYVLTRLNIRDYSNVQNIFHVLYNLKIGEKDILTLGSDCMGDYLMSYQFADNGDYEQTVADVFAQYDWNPLERLNVIAGLRYDYFSESDDASFSPKLALMYKLNDYALRASYSAGFRAPTLKEMYMDFYMGNIFMIYGNPNLKSEKSHNFSLSGEYRKGSYNATLTGFYNIVNDRITTAWDQSRNGQVYVNMDRVNILAVDANVSARYKFGLSWKASYEYTYEHVPAGSPEVSTTRPHTATVRIGYDKDWKNYGFGITLMGRYLSEVTADEYTKVNSYEETVSQTYPGYMMWNMNISQRVWQGVNVTLSIDNLLNYKPSYYYYNSPYTTGTTFAVGVSIDIDNLAKKIF